MGEYDVGALQDRITAAVGGMDRFASNWSWRSHSPKRQAEEAVSEAVATVGDGIAALLEKCATAEQVEEWTEKAIRLWLAYQAAGARTANPMITGPANFPVARNQKAMAAEPYRCQRTCIAMRDECRGALQPALRR